MSDFDDPELVSLEAARAWLRENIDEGVSCPCCGQLAKIYRRKLNSAMARRLIRFYRAAGARWFHSPSLARVDGDTGKLALWGLVEEEKTKRPDGGRSGFWRVTEGGEDWTLRRSSVAKYALVYDGRLLGYDGSQVTIIDALGTKFNYDELMRGE
jgi:hypothetical protein